MDLDLSKLIEIALACGIIAAAFFCGYLTGFARGFRKGRHEYFASREARLRKLMEEGGA